MAIRHSVWGIHIALSTCTELDKVSSKGGGGGQCSPPPTSDLCYPANPRLVNLRILRGLDKLTLANKEDTYYTSRIL